MTGDWMLVAATAVVMLVSLTAMIVAVVQRVRAQHKARLYSSDNNPLGRGKAEPQQPHEGNEK